MGILSTPISKKGLFAGILFGRFNPVCRALLCQLKSKKLSVLGYHRIYDNSSPDYPFNRETISAYSEEFDRQMEFVSRHFNVINFRMLSDILASGAAVPDNSLIITFDDGYMDNYETALPILKKHGLTATIYVSTGFITTGEIFWFEKISYQLNKMRPGRLCLRSGKFERVVGQGKRPEMRRDVLDFLFGLPSEERLVALKELDEQTKVEVSEADLHHVRPLTWEQIVELDGAGIEIGSHTVTHPILSRMTENEIEYELRESKKILEERIGKDIVSVSYPFGGARHYDKRVMEIARKCGYHFGISYRHGVQALDETIRFEIPRIHVETYTDFPMFQGQLLMPGIFTYANPPS